MKPHRDRAPGTRDQTASLESGAIQNGLGTSRFGRSLHVYECVGSTNDLARALADQEAPEGATVIAAEQTGGRGRRGRPWQSPAGGLWLSVVLRPTLEAAQWPLVGFSASVGAAAAVEDATGVPVALKWPNDLMASGRKLGGVLVEAHGTPHARAARWGRSALIVGIGINANFSPDALPPEISARAVSLLGLLGHPVDLAHLAGLVLMQFERHYDLLQRDSDALLVQWRARDLMVGRVVRISGAHTLEGTVEGVDGSGGLLVGTAAGVQRVAAGEVSLRDADSP